MVNRAALMLRYKEPMIRWINEAEPSDDPPVTQEETDLAQTVYLIDVGATESPLVTHRWLRRNFDMLFNLELVSWFTEPEMWPKRRTFRMFQDWFEVTVHAAVADLEGTEIFDDEWPDA